MNNDNKNANKGRKYGTAYLTFTNLKGSAYKKGNLIVESTLKKESKNSPLCKLASFTDMIVEDCAINESKTGTNISVCVNAIGENNMKRLYEWLKKYTNENMISEIAPGLLESLELINNEEQVNEDSVASRFSKYRKLYEADNDEELEKGDDNGKESDDENSDSTGESKKEDDGDDPEDSEEEELTAVIIEVKKGDEDAAKQEMIDAGVDEDDIEILEPEKEDDEDDDENGDTDGDNAENESEDEDKDTDDDFSDETVKIKVSIDSFDALKDYLEGKGFDLEEELGGEIVTDDEDGEDEDGEDEDGDDKEKDEMEDTFDGFDDLFGDMDDSDDSKDEKK